ncbi:MAG: tRNA (adenosine(37)-N6)-dimethylallyltransferase MiaA [Magnetococcales bacterium]|nr:tRNA (adenosine(37)-N6)-dimethylallyltransferase MiaA [Magnetococcales bacterium]
MKSWDSIVVLGATASGKTGLAVALARQLNGEIISADSRQVFKGMDIGTGKELESYGEIPVHLVDEVECGEPFSVYDFQKRFYQYYQEIKTRNMMPILAGGTGLYLDAALSKTRILAVPINPTFHKLMGALPLETLQEKLISIQPDQHNTTDIKDKNRLIRALEIAEAKLVSPVEPAPESHPLIFGIRWPRKELAKRIDQRLKQRLEHGMIQEVRNLLDGGVPAETLEYYGLEYRFLTQFVTGRLRRNDMVQKLNSAIRQFAKRQETWFRRMEKNGTQIHWLDGYQNPLQHALKRCGIQ